jgi:hypothetical protein
MRAGTAELREGGFALLAVLAAILLALPTQADALDSDLKHSAAFRLEASNGFSIIAIAASERVDGRGSVFLIVHRGSTVATYAAAATLTGTKLEVDLGPLGRISLDVVSSGLKRKLRSSCGGEPETFAFEPQSYRGVFEFHGEEGYTEATTASPREYTRFFLDLACGTAVAHGEASGNDLPGARLRVRSGKGHRRFSLQVNKNRPRARSRFEVEIHEKRQGITISRSTTLRAGAAAFAYDPMLRTAVLEPPTPFSGRATYRRGAPAANRWTGNLTVDLPGRSGVPLADTGALATLVPSCWHAGGGRFRC